MWTGNGNSRFALDYERDSRTSSINPSSDYIPWLYDRMSIPPCYHVKWLDRAAWLVWSDCDIPGSQNSWNHKYPRLLQG
jgi:hypothetical protein